MEEGLEIESQIHIERKKETEEDYDSQLTEQLKLAGVPLGD